MNGSRLQWKNRAGGATVNAALLLFYMCGGFKKSNRNLQEASTTAEMAAVPSLHPKEPINSQTAKQMSQSCCCVDKRRGFKLCGPHYRSKDVDVYL